jgi:hypothetical protein
VGRGAFQERAETTVARALNRCTDPLHPPLPYSCRCESSRPGEQRLAVLATARMAGATIASTATPASRCPRVLFASIAYMER